MLFRSDGIARYEEAVSRQGNPRPTGSREQDFFWWLASRVLRSHLRWTVADAFSAAVRVLSSPTSASLQAPVTRPRVLATETDGAAILEEPWGAQGLPRAACEWPTEL